MQCLYTSLTEKSALILNATTVQESTTQQPLTLFQGASIQGGTFNISVMPGMKVPLCPCILQDPKAARHFVIE